MKKPLTALAIEHAKPRAKRYALPDVGHPGLRVLVYPSGVRTFVYRFRRGDKQDVTVVLGPASGPGALTLAQARDAAGDARRQRAMGADPADQKRASRRAEAARIAAEEQEARRREDTVANVLARYYADHADGLKSGREVRRVLDKELKGWAKKRVDDIRRSDAIRVLDTVKVRAPIQSKRLRAYGRHFFQWCITKELVEKNPFDGTAVVKEVPRDRVLTDDELRLLLRAIDRLEWPRRQFVHLLLLSAQRLNEVGDMEWSELDLTSDTPTWTLPGARAKNGRAHAVPLAPITVEILTSMDRVKDTPRVFASFSAAHAKTRIDEVMLEIAREDAAAGGDNPEEVKIEPWRLHDLRRTAATTMPRLGVDVVTVERVLNHQMRGVMAVYQRHSFAQEKRHALNLWADFLTSLTAVRESNVVPFKAEA
ncbi:tyrosine-type recombinase/integrase [Bradyrhizobium iriomotense]|uniref:tyrosine-type recombinase/integrase n=1 Tax=Bradyrhizobium iriomotense TaxID=441950 RepID=UPI001B89EA33|nr:site-specific integrase [Bradyrhizobium iriomotense]MBR1128402.1 tyrosine-type recombinase/integrase [Bradyrhizobium iriomotense]